MSDRDPNYKTNPMIQLAKKACTAADGAVAFLVIVQKDGSLTGFSYGINRKLCDIGGELMDEAIVALEDAVEGRLP